MKLQYGQVRKQKQLASEEKQLQMVLVDFVERFERQIRSLLPPSSLLRKMGDNRQFVGINLLRERTSANWRKQP